MLYKPMLYKRILIIKIAQIYGINRYSKKFQILVKYNYTYILKIYSIKFDV